jgi:choline dehydrogenase-like flavoprotein
VAESADFDAVVVGAGPAGSSAALALARAGRSVVMVERGPFPGSKNVYGGVVYGQGARRHRPRLVERGAGGTVGGAPLDHDDDRGPSRWPWTTGPMRGAWPPTTG